jgi:hypothetical protein
MKTMLASLLLLLATAFSSSADAACFNVAPQTMQVKFKNNSSETVYIYIEAPQIFTPKSPPARAATADLWLQAQCEISSSASYDKPFYHTVLTRAWINVQNRAALGNSAMGVPPLSNAGIPPGNTVTVTLPFYTQLRNDVTAANLGDVNQPDQFIDWWNGGRLVVFYRVEGAVSIFDEDFPQPVAFNASNLPGGKQPSCSTDIMGNPPCSITYNSYIVQPDVHVGFQLQEFTFASAVGPPPGGNAAFTIFNIDTLAPNKYFPTKYAFPNLNYNVSSLDSVYLPMALGPMDPTKIGQPPIPSTDNTQYVGSGDNVSDFVGKIRAFSGQNGDGTGWPYYIPLYFDSTQNVMCGTPPNQQLCWYPVNFRNNPSPPPAQFPNAPCSMNTHFRIPNQYVFPKIPGVANLLTESFNRDTNVNFVSNPPILSGNPVNYQTLNGYANNLCHDFQPGPAFINPPTLGTHGQQLFDLWRNCTTNPQFPDVNQTCAKINDLNAFFTANYNNPMNSCTQGHTPKIPLDPVNDLVSILAAVYGWVPITNPLYPKTPQKPCTGPALNTDQAAFDKNFGEFCDLQYNYLTLPNLPANNQYIFNPYVQLIHSPNFLNSTAYAFSVDDGVAYRQIHGSPGLIFAFGGPGGLDFPTPTPVPTAANYRTQCKGIPPKLPPTP